MNTSLSFTLGLAAMLMASSRGFGSDLLDFPGPEYRQQRERFANERSSNPRALLLIHTEFIHPQLFDREPPFSAPVRLFDSTTASPALIKAGSGTLAPEVSPTRPMEGPKPVMTK